MLRLTPRLSFFFFNDTATTEIYTLSLHDALPICVRPGAAGPVAPHRIPPGDPLPRPSPQLVAGGADGRGRGSPDRKSTRLNSSHQIISYAVFCLKKKKNNTCSTIAANGPSTHPRH